MTIPKAILWALLVTLLVMGFYPALSTPAPFQPQVRSRSEEGPIRAQKVVVLSAEMSGLVTQIPYVPQDFVRKGDLLVQLDPNLVEIEIKRIRSQIQMDTGIREADTKLKFHAENLKIAQNLSNEKLDNVSVGSPKELHEAQQAYDLALLGETRAKLALQELEYNLQRNITLRQKHTIRAPWDGVVMKLGDVVGVANLTTNTKQTEVGEMIQAGQPVIALMKVDYMRFQAQLPIEDLSGVHLGQPARVTVKGHPEPVEARVIYISPNLNSGGNNINIEVEFANPLLTGKDLPKSAYRYRFRPTMYATRIELIKDK